MRPHVRRFRESGRVSHVILLLAVLFVATFAAMSASASSVLSESAIAAADELAAHGIELRTVPATAPGAAVSAETARAAARQLVGASKDPEETYRVFASETYLSAKQTAWLFLFAGGPGPVSAGPPEGADSRAYTTKYTGVVIDDQTGEILRWFQGGAFTP
jgi:hypothetical protein